MKKILSVILLLSIVVSCLSSCADLFHLHTWGEWDYLENPTCYESGTQIHICVECGEEEIQTVDAKGHSFSNWKTIREATCTEEGMKRRTCTDCGENETVDIAAKGHAFSGWVCIADATCTENGMQRRTCTDCGENETTDIAAKGHTFGSWSKVYDATCTEKGLKNRVCVDCSYEETLAIDAIGHDWKSATCTEPKTCNNCGDTQGKALGHNKNGDYCTVCGEKVTIDMNTIVGNPNECSTTSYFGFCYYKNSADGIKVCWGAENLSGKTINYYTVTLYFFNSVDDPAYSEITGKSSKTLKYVGPIAPNGDMLIYGIVDYVPTCKKVLIGEITLEYSDGTTDSGWYGWYTKYSNSNIK